MSHLTTIKTVFKNLDTLRATISEMGYEVVDVKNLDMRMRYDGRRDEPVEFAISRKGKHEVWMGIQANNGVYNLIGDSYGKGFDMDKFSKDLTKTYATNEVKHQFATIPELSAFSLSSEKEENGEITLIFNKW